MILTTIVLSTEIVWIAVLALMSLLGWGLALYEYESKSRKIKNLEVSTSDLKLKMEDAERKHKDELVSTKEQLDKHYQSVQKDLSDKHESVKADLESQLKSMTDLRESELEEVEELVKGKISEIENAYKEVIDDQNESLELYENYIRNFDAAITLADKKLKEIDSKGIFENDDEVGIFFKNIMYLQGALNKFKIDKEVLDENQKQKLEGK